MRLSDLWRWEEPIARGPYALVGILAFALKFSLDRFVAAMYGHQWSLISYWRPVGQLTRLQSFAGGDSRFLVVMLALSLPFAWLGIGMTLRRMRSAGIPGGLVVLFFVPFLNLLFLATLCILPARTLRWWSGSARAQKEPETPDGTAQRMPEVDATCPPAQRTFERLVPRGFLGSAALAALLTVPLGVGVTLFAVKVAVTYGWTLFVVLPFALGMIAALLHGYHERRGLGACVLVALAAVGILGALLLAVAIEGVICVIMAAPIAVSLAVLGGIVGYVVQDRPRHGREAPLVVASILFLLPPLTLVERGIAPDPSVFETRTSIVVEAPPEVVWKQVVAFSEIPPPREWYFKTGVAYPMRAEIHGTGPGAVRHCVFSTGDFIEPIEVWDPPRLLKFSVTSCPAPMAEWTFTGSLDTPHLHGFLVSNAGQFRLTPLPGGRTLLEGTTWYRHGLWPERYWLFWSDAIIHRIHLRVLQHVKAEAEADEGEVANHALK